MTRKLNEITSELRSLLYTLEDQAGELDENLEAALDECEGELKDKIDSMLSACDDMTAKSQVYKERAEKFKAAQKALENRVERIKGWVSTNMQLAGLKRFETANFPKISLRPSTMVKIYDEPLFWGLVEKDAAYRGQYTNETVKITPNKKAINEDLKAGKVVAGIHLQQNWNLNY